MADDSPSLAIFGFPSSGKTNFLYALCYHSTHGHGRWSFLPHGARTNQWFTALKESYERESVPDATRDLHEIAFRIRTKEVGREFEFNAAVWDPPGEGVKDAFFREYDSLGEDAREIVDGLIDLVRDALGFIIILDSEHVIADPAREAHFCQEFARQLRRQELGEGKSVRPVAFVFTKSDLADHPMVDPEKRRKLSRLRDDPNAYAEEEAFPGIVPNLRADLGSFSYFSTSAYGKANWVHDDMTQGWAPMDKKIDPANVTEPLDWVMERIPMASAQIQRKGFLQDLKFWAVRVVAAVVILLLLGDLTFFGIAYFKSSNQQAEPAERYAVLDKYLDTMQVGLCRGFAKKRLRTVESEVGQGLLEDAKSRWTEVVLKDDEGNWTVKPSDVNEAVALRTELREKLVEYLEDRPDAPEEDREAIETFLASSADEVLELLEEELKSEWKKSDGQKPAQRWTLLSKLKLRTEKQLEQPEGSEERREKLTRFMARAGGEANRATLKDLRREWELHTQDDFQSGWKRLEKVRALVAGVREDFPQVDSSQLDQFLTTATREANQDALKILRLDWEGHPKDVWDAQDDGSAWKKVAELHDGVQTLYEQHPKAVDKTEFDGFLEEIDEAAVEAYMEIAAETRGPSGYLGFLRSAPPGVAELEKQLFARVEKGVKARWRTFKGTHLDRWFEADRLVRETRMLPKSWHHADKDGCGELTSWADRMRSGAKERFVAGVQETLDDKVKPGVAHIRKEKRRGVKPTKLRILREQLLNDLGPTLKEVAQAQQRFGAQPNLRKLEGELRKPLQGLEREQWRALQLQEATAVGPDECRRMLQRFADFLEFFQDSTHVDQVRAWRRDYSNLRKELKCFATVDLPRPGWTVVTRSQTPQNKLSPSYLQIAFRNDAGAWVGYYLISPRARVRDHTSWLRGVPGLDQPKASSLRPRGKMAYYTLRTTTHRGVLGWGKFGQTVSLVGYCAKEDERSLREVRALIEAFSHPSQIVIDLGTATHRGKKELMVNGTYQLEIHYGRKKERRFSKERTPTKTITWADPRVTFPFTPGQLPTFKLSFKRRGESKETIAHWDTRNVGRLDTSSRTRSASGIKLEFTLSAGY